MSAAYCFGRWCHIQIALVRWIDRMYARTQRTPVLLRTRGDVDDDDGGCIDTDRNRAGLCVLQSVSIVCLGVQTRCTFEFRLFLPNKFA